MTCAVPKPLRCLCSTLSASQVGSVSAVPLALAGVLLTILQQTVDLEAIIPIPSRQPSIPISMASAERSICARPRPPRQALSQPSLMKQPSTSKPCLVNGCLPSTTALPALSWPSSSEVLMNMVVRAVPLRPVIRLRRMMLLRMRSIILTTREVRAIYATPSSPALTALMIVQILCISVFAPAEFRCLMAGFSAFLEFPAVGLTANGMLRIAAFRN